jgi:Zn-dependent protease with chaperone function
MSRLLRIALVVALLIPLPLFAKRFCWLDFVDATYHSLLWLHEHMMAVFLLYGVLLGGAAIVRVARVHGGFVSLEELCSEPPERAVAAFLRAAHRFAIDPVRLVYVDVSAVFCFTIPGRRVVISKGFLETLDDDELELVASHEILHVRRHDATRALLWHIVFNALVVPGFDRLERELYSRRELRVDAVARLADPVRYDLLLARFREAGFCSSSPVAAFQNSPRSALPRALIAFSAVIPLVLLALLATSHIVVITDLAYLHSHHC